MMKRMSKQVGRVSALALALTLALAGCGDSTEPLTFEEIEDVPFHESLNVDLSQMTRTDEGLYYQDLVVGDGELAEAGAQVNVNYVGRFRSGVTFDAGSFSFTIDGGAVIEGFNDGIRGMRAGGERKIIIPPALAYNVRGPEGILVFDIELVDVTPPAS